ncbi:MAG: sigma-70 family RNA polymerase sigma factor [Melioribacteraceae bacterium]|nr:sigma-70 family RNA polymerase sigma factor [Melioribacteraceae bacterium]
MEKVKARESRALEELYERYSPLIYTLVKKILGDIDLTNKTLIEIFTIIWRKAEKSSAAKGNIYAWLIQLTRNKAVDIARRSRDNEFSQVPYDDEYEDFFIIPTFSEKMDSLDIATAMEIRLNIEKALAKLTDTQKYVIHLAYYDGFTLDEISKKLSLPVETLRTKVMTALHALRDNLLAEA